MPFERIKEKIQEERGTNELRRVRDENLRAESLRIKRIEEEQTRQEEQQRLKDRSAREMFYKESPIPAALTELGGLVNIDMQGHENIPLNGGKTFIIKGNLVFSIRIDEKGTISVDGDGFLHSKSISARAWRFNPNLVSKAIEDAYLHPKTVFQSSINNDYEVGNRP